MILRFHQATGSATKQDFRQASFLPEKRYHLSFKILLASLLMTIPGTTALHSEQLYLIKQSSALSSTHNNYQQRVKPDSASTSRMLKDLPFKQLTTGRILVSKNKTHHQPTYNSPHQGKRWLEFIIEKDDTLYSLVMKNGLSIKELFKIMHMGAETAGLKLLKPGQKLRIHASGENILELIHHQTGSRKLHVKKVDNVFTGFTLDKGIQVEPAEVTPPHQHQQPDSLYARKDNYPLLRKQSDTTLQNKLEKTIQYLGLMKQVDKKKLAVALVDISNMMDPRLAMLNGDEMMYAASLPKIAILLGAFVEIEQGNMILDNKTRDSLIQMIRFSSNEDATKLLDRIGNHRLQEILMSDRFKLYDPINNGGLWVGKAYGKTPAFERDPLHNLSHGATVLQAARFYYLMETGQLVSRKLTADMKETLSQPKIKHKFVKGLANRPEANIYRKSGSWRHWHSDSALIEVDGYKYIVVALAENSEGGQWLAEMIAPLHDLIVPRTYASLKH